jgi:hypothetical protein
MRDPQIEQHMMMAEAMQRATPTNKSLKSRTPNTLPLAFTDLTAVLTNHIRQMSHFRAWAPRLRWLRAVYGNPSVRAAIVQQHGKSTLATIDQTLNDFATGGRSKVQVMGWLDKLRRNFTIGVLAGKVHIALKQLPQTLLYATKMPYGDYVAGCKSFLEDPIGNSRRLAAASATLRDRFGGGYERDIHDALTHSRRQHLGKKLTAADVLFWQNMAADRAQICMGAHAAWYSAKRHGASDAEAIAFAERVTEEVQASHNVVGLSVAERHSPGSKIVTMFMRDANKYFRIISDNARHFRHGRGSRARAAANIAIAWVVVPSIYQLVADAFRWDKERQTRALVLGPINNMLVVGNFAQMIWETAWSGRQPDVAGAVSPVLGLVEDVLNTGLRVRRLAKKRASGEEVPAEDYVRVAEDVSMILGETLGIPTPYIVQAERAVREGRPVKLIFSNYALGEKRKTEERGTQPRR